MTDQDAFDRQLAREVDHLAGPEPRVDVDAIVSEAIRPAMRPRLDWLHGSLRLSAATAVIALMAAVLVFGWIVGGDEAAVLAPGVSPSPARSPEPSAGASVLVSGAWSGPDPSACAPARLTIAPGVQSLTRCPGLSFTADDPRLTAEGATWRETWSDIGASSETWKLTNQGGTWTSRRQFDHDRFVFVGENGYQGMNAVLTLSEDGTFSGFIRTGRQTDE